jgi:rfaE bifunctional protein nucleotidyltransferase chain/domain
MSEREARAETLRGAWEPDALLEEIGRLRKAGKRIVLTNGCFDLLHVGHVRTLQAARRLGDVLVVAINSDASVRGLKGRGRPIVPAGERAEVLAALTCVDYVVTFDEPDPLRVVLALKPDVLAKGGDWTLDTIVGRREVEALGGKVVALPEIAGMRTTSLVQRVLRDCGKTRVPPQENGQ